MEKYNSRGGYGFNYSDKEKVARRARNTCEHIDCLRPNNGITHHLEGIFIAKLEKKPKSVIRNPELNALKLCNLHNLPITLYAR